MKRSRIDVAELVAVVTTHPTVAVDVAAGLVTVKGPLNVSAPAAVVVAFPPTHRGPPMVADCVVEELTNVLTPVTLSVLSNVRAPAAVVVACPPTQRGPPMVADCVVEELTNVLTPVTESVPPVEMFVLMVVAA